jgi:tagaturonate reductase
MHEPALRDGLEEVWSKEVITVFEVLGPGPQAREYVDVVRSRLCIPSWNIRSRISPKNHEQKKARRVAPLLELAARVGVRGNATHLRRLGH